MVNIDIGKHIKYFAAHDTENITLLRYSVEYDKNGHRNIVDDPERYIIEGSIQQVDSEVEWVEEGTDISEFRDIYLEYPYKAPHGEKYSFNIRTRVDEEESAPVDGIFYKGQHFDFVRKLGEYDQYGFEHFIIQLV